MVPHHSIRRFFVAIVTLSPGVVQSAEGAGSLTFYVQKSAGNVVVIVQPPRPCSESGGVSLVIGE
jgi:hypothetical protein